MDPRFCPITRLGGSTLAPRTFARLPFRSPDFFPVLTVVPKAPWKAATSQFVREASIMKRGFMLILFLFQTTVSTADESVREEIRALQARLAELERQAGKPRASGGNEFNPRITAFGDFTGRIDNGPVRNENNEEISDRFNMREVELDLRADVDPYAKGVLITALSQERPLQPASVAIEEGYVLFTALSRGVSAKAGKFKNAFGILNQLHLHDLPQSTLPLPIQTFLGEDGMAEMGLSVHYIMPQKNPDHVLSLTGEVFNGENATQFVGVSSRDPAYLGRAKYYMELDPESFMELGTSYMNGKRDRKSAV